MLPQVVFAMGHLGRSGRPPAERSVVQVVVCQTASWLPAIIGESGRPVATSPNHAEACPAGPASDTRPPFSLHVGTNGSGSMTWRVTPPMSYTALGEARSNSSSFASGHRRRKATAQCEHTGSRSSNSGPFSFPSRLFSEVIPSLV